MLPNEPSSEFKYNFAHKILPIMAFSDSSEFYQNVSKPNASEYFNEIWNELSKTLNPKISSLGLNVSFFTSEENIEVAIITLPSPDKTPEAFFVATVFKIKDLSLNRDIQSVRCFTLELGRSPYDKSDEHHFCEWVADSKLNFQHKNYGKLPNQRLNTFKSAVIESMGISNLTDIESTRQISIDNMSELEKKQFILHKLLPKMEELALERFAEQEDVINKTMTYVDQAKKEHKRSILIRQIFWVLLALAFGICITLTCVSFLYFGLSFFYS